MPEHPVFDASEPTGPLSLGSGAKLPGAGGPTSSGSADGQSAYDGKGIDPDLIPYLMAAEEEPEEEFAGAEATDADNLAALRRMVESSALSGFDPQLVAEMLGEVSDDELAGLADDWDDDEEESADLISPLAQLGGGATQQDAAEQAQERAQVLAEVRLLERELFARAPEHKFAPSLDRIKLLLDMLGNPQSAYPSVHVAGTNGKTSTARMIDALLGAFDLRVGRFTSPHLRDVRERISFEGAPATPEQFLYLWQDIAPYVALTDQQSAEAGGPTLSFFEVLVAMAYAGFADYPVDVAVVETGMGGVWDATNVIDSGVAVLTSIDLDHQQWLGNTIEEIAAEKVGIIKDRSIVVSMEQPSSVTELVEARCRETDSVLWLEGRDWAVLARTPLEAGQMVSLQTPAGVYEEIFIPLQGAHQARNAGAALVATEAMMGGKTLPGDLVDAGFQAARSPGRLEVLRTSPRVIVDSAHNPAGGRALAAALEESFGLEYAVGLYAAMADKDVELVLAEMEPHLEQLVVTTTSSTRAMDLERLTEIAVDVFGEDRVHAEQDLPDALDKAGELVDMSSDPENGKGIVVFGSVVLAGDVSALLRPDQQLS